jgi:ABC-type dipeptide transport system, periplasmic component
MNKTKVLGAAGVFVLLIASMSFTASQGVRYNTPADTLVYARSGDTRLLDPAEAYDTASSLVIGNVYETLVEDDFENGEFVGVKPLLATSWTISNDGLVYTFNLRKGVKFHDGTDFNASAVKYTLDRLVTMNMGPANPLIGHVYVSSMVIDEHTIKIELEHPFIPFLTCMAHTAACIVSPTAVEAHGGYEKGKPSEWMRKNMVGTGPYVFDHWTEDEETLLVRNGNYWGEKPKMQKILIKQISEKLTC